MLKHHKNILSMTSSRLSWSERKAYIDSTIMEEHAHKRSSQSDILLQVSGHGGGHHLL